MSICNVNRDKNLEAILSYSYRLGYSLRPVLLNNVFATTASENYFVDNFPLWCVCKYKYLIWKEDDEEQINTFQCLTNFVLPLCDLVVGLDKYL